MASLLISEVYTLIAHHSAACAKLAARFEHESKKFKDHMERIQVLTDYIADELDYHSEKDQNGDDLHEPGDPGSAPLRDDAAIASQDGDQ